MGFQPQSGINTALDSAAYCYVPIPPILYYSSAIIFHHKGSSAHLEIYRFCTRISSLHTGSSAHLGFARHHTSIYNSLLVCPCCDPQTLLRVTLTLPPPPIFTKYFIQVFSKLCLHCLWTPLCVPPATSHPIDPHPFAHLENHHPM